MIIITGCAGFIGSHLSEFLLKKKYNVIGVDNINDYYDIRLKHDNLKILKKYPNFEFIKEDVITSKCIEKFKPEIVIHLSSYAGVRYSIENPSLYAKNNIISHINLLEQSVKVGVKKFIYASSSSVYGTNKKIPFCENDIVNDQSSPYAVSKICMEKYSDLYNKMYKIPIIGLRFFTVYGPRGRVDMAPYKFLSAINTGTEFNKFGDGTSQRDYTYIDDIVMGIYGAINHNCDTHELYNLGNSNTVCLNDFISTCEKICNKKAKFKQLETQMGDVPITYANISKAKNDLNYNPITNLEDGLRNTFNWIKNGDKFS